MRIRHLSHKLKLYEFYHMQSKHNNMSTLHIFLCTIIIKLWELFEIRIIHHLARFIILFRNAKTVIQDRNATLAKTITANCADVNKVK